MTVSLGANTGHESPECGVWSQGVVDGPPVFDQASGLAERGEQASVDEAADAALYEGVLGRQQDRSPGPDSPFAAAYPADRQPFFTMDAEDLLVVRIKTFASEQDAKSQYPNRRRSLTDRASVLTRCYQRRSASATGTSSGPVLLGRRPPPLAQPVLTHHVMHDHALEKLFELRPFKAACPGQ